MRRANCVIDLGHLADDHAAQEGAKKAK